MRRRLITLVLSASMLAGLAVVVPSIATPDKAPQAEARVYGTNQALQQARAYMGIYDIAIHRACVQRHGAGAFAYAMDVWNPYTWQCFRVAQWWPHQWVHLGGLDLNRYCAENHPGTRAVLEPYVPVVRVMAWKCQR